MAWISFGALPCRKKNLMTARVSMSLKSRASLTCFRACFLPARAKYLSAPRYCCIKCGWPVYLMLYRFIQNDCTKKHLLKPSLLLCRKRCVGGGQRFCTWFEGRQHWLVLYTVRCFPISRSQTSGLQKGKVGVWVLSQTLPPEIACSKSASLSAEGEFVHLVHSFIRSLKTESVNGSIPVPDLSHAFCYVQV